MLHGQEAGGEVAFEDTHGLAGEEAVGIGKLEELGGLVGDADDAEAFFDDASGECGVNLGIDFALAARDRIAVRIGRGMAEESVEAVEDFVRDGVFELLGFGVDGAPVHLEDVDEEGFDEAVFAEDIEGDAAALRSEAHALARAMLDVAGIGKGFDHRGDGAGNDGERFGEGAHGDEAVGAVALGKQQHVLEVIFNGARGHVGEIGVRGFDATKDLF